MFDVKVSFSIFKEFKLSHKTDAGVAYLDPGSEKLLGTPPQGLVIPWQSEINPNADIFTLLHWRSCLSRFSGRTKEEAELTKWANGDSEVSIKFICGEGGVGKTRLAAEFATKLRDEHKWGAGFVDLRKAQSFILRKKGTLLVIDYPEENRTGVEEFLRDLSGIGDVVRLRILFLTRQPLDAWLPLINDCKVNVFLDPPPVNLLGLPAPSAHELYDSALTRAADHFKSHPPKLSQEALTAWLAEAPEHDRPLFTVAVAVYSALFPNDLVVTFSHTKIVNELVERELSRLRNLARELGCDDEYACARMLAVAAFDDPLSLERVRKLADIPELRLGFPEGSDPALKLKNTGLVHNGVIPAPKPDIVAAAFVVSVLREDPSTAPELIWQALEGNILLNFSRFYRLSFDSEIVLGIRQHLLSDYLARAIEGKYSRVCRVVNMLVAPPISRSCLPAAIIVNKELLNHAKEDQERAEIFINYSSCLSELGEIDQAINAIEKSISLLRNIEPKKEEDHMFALGTSFHNYAILLLGKGQFGRSVDKLQEAVIVWKELVKRDPKRYDSSLSMSLNSLSNAYRRLGNKKEALRSASEAVEIDDRIARERSNLFDPNLAISLNTLGLCYFEMNRTDIALPIMERVIQIRRQLSEYAPDRFYSDLAVSLNNYAICLNGEDREDEAINVLKEAIDIQHQLARANPARFEFELYMSYGNLANVLTDLRRADDALDAIAVAIKGFFSLIQDNTVRVSQELAICFGNRGSLLHAKGRFKEAMEAFQNAANLTKPYIEVNIEGPNARRYKDFLSGAERARAKLDTGTSPNPVPHQE